MQSRPAVSAPRDHGWDSRRPGGALALPLSSCMTWGKQSSPALLLFPPVENGVATAISGLCKDGQQHREPEAALGQGLAYAYLSVPVWGP